MYDGLPRFRVRTLKLPLYYANLTMSFALIRGMKNQGEGEFRFASPHFLRLLRLAIIISFILSIIGGTDATSTNSSTRSTGTTLRKAGAIVFVVCYAIIAGILFLFWENAKQILPHRKTVRKPLLISRTSNADRPGLANSSSTASPAHFPSSPYASSIPSSPPSAPRRRSGLTARSRSQTLPCRNSTPSPESGRSTWAWLSSWNSSSWVSTSASALHSPTSSRRPKVRKMAMHTRWKGTEIRRSLLPFEVIFIPGPLSSLFTPFDSYSTASFHFITDASFICWLMITSREYDAPCQAT